MWDKLSEWNNWFIAAGILLAIAGCFAFREYTVETYPDGYVRVGMFVTEDVGPMNNENMEKEKSDK